LFWGIIGSLLALVPATMLLPILRPLISPLRELFPLIWAILVGGLVTFAWSNALHERVTTLGYRLDSLGALAPDEKEQYAARLQWIPGWLGIFERVFYSLLIGLDVTGGAAFIGVWVGIKLAGGWQSWSKGTTYGRAIFFIGLLGNAMSILFGVVAGLVLRSYLHP
jgi:hypothetical protein